MTRYGQPRLRVPIKACALIFYACLLSGSAEEAPAPPLQTPQPEQPETLCPVSERGAVADGATYDTAAIQAAIDACAKAETGNGVVVLDADKQYLTGKLALRSGVRLRIPKGTTLLAGPEREDYSGDPSEWFLIWIDRCQRCGVEGGGRIDGQGAKWVLESMTAHKNVRNWLDPQCLEATDCRPGLIGVRDSQQVTVEGVELASLAFWGMHVARSEAVATVGVTVSADPLMPGTHGVILDGCRRVYVGACAIAVGGNALTIRTSTEMADAEFVLVDNTLLQSRSVALAVGPDTRRALRTMIFQNLHIRDSHRGIALALRDEGSISNLQFQNISITTRLYERFWTGGAEPIYITAMGRHAHSKIGAIADIQFGNISAVSEAGVLVVGAPDSTVDRISFESVQLTLNQTSNELGGFRDLGPSPFGIINDIETAAIYLEQANHISLRDIQVTWSKPAREEWGQVLEIAPRTTHAVTIQGLTMHDESAHPATSGAAAAAPAFKLRDFVRTIRSNLRSNGHAFISSQANAATGVQGRRAASSASVTVLILTAVVVVVLVVAHVCDLSWLRGARPAGMRKVAGA